MPNILTTAKLFVSSISYQYVARNQLEYAVLAGIQDWNFTLTDTPHYFFENLAKWVDFLNEKHPKCNGLSIDLRETDTSYIIQIGRPLFLIDLKPILTEALYGENSDSLKTELEPFVNTQVLCTL